jgi:hypothetical protein
LVSTSFQTEFGNEEERSLGTRKEDDEDVPPVTKD